MPQESKHGTKETDSEIICLWNINLGARCPISYIVSFLFERYLIWMCLSTPSTVEAKDGDAYGWIDAVLLTAFLLSKTGSFQVILQYIPLTTKTSLSLIREPI